MRDDYNPYLEKRYRHLIEHLRDAVFVANPRGHYIDVNPAACLMLGYKKDDLLKMSVTDIAWPGEAGWQF